MQVEATNFFAFACVRAWTMVGMTEGSVHNQHTSMARAHTHKRTWISSRKRVC